MNDASEFWEALREYDMTFSNGREFFELDHLVQIWGKASCPFCEKAKFMTKQFGLDYIYHQLDEDFTREEFLERFPDAKTFPQIIVDDKYIGGYDDYRIFLKGPPKYRA